MCQCKLAGDIHLVGSRPRSVCCLLSMHGALGLEQWQNMHLLLWTHDLPYLFRVIYALNDPLHFPVNKMSLPSCSTGRVPNPTALVRMLSRGRAHDVKGTLGSGHIVLLGHNGEGKVRDDISNQCGEPWSVTSIMPFVINSMLFLQSLGIVLRKALIWLSLDMHLAKSFAAHSSITWSCTWNLEKFLSQC